MQVVATDKAPGAVGPYSQAIIANGFVFLSGQIPLDPSTGSMVTGTITMETTQVLNNLKAVLESSGSDLSRVVKTTVYLKDMADFEEMNRTYAEFFKSNKPARATIQVGALPRNARVEIEAVALL
jgi:2-iminobutanoate/2-iminopropanoate deaminase